MTAAASGEVSIDVTNSRSIFSSWTGIRDSDGQRGVAGAEVVEGQPDALVAEPAEHPVDDLELAERQRLGQLEDQPVGRQVVGAQPGQHGAGEPRVEQAARARR